MDIVSDDIIPLDKIMHCHTGKNIDLPLVFLHNRVIKDVDFNVRMCKENFFIVYFKISIFIKSFSETKHNYSNLKTKITVKRISFTFLKLEKSRDSGFCFFLPAIFSS